jgi:hypothetical protein
MLSRAVLLFRPLPPSGETEFLNWLAENKIFIAIQNEIFFFATMCLIPSAMVLQKLSQNRPTISSVLGVGLVFVTIPVLAVVNLAEGRLVYPVYDIQLSFDVLKLMLSLFHGGLHVVALIFAVAIVAVGLGMRDAVFPRVYWYLSLVAGLLQIPFAYAWLTGYALNLIAIFFLGLWLVMSGIYSIQHAQSHTIYVTESSKAI